MTDLEMTKLCAEALGYVRVEIGPRRGIGSETGVWVSRYTVGCMSIFDPLKRNDCFSDGQAMALVKHFALELMSPLDTGHWLCIAYIFVGQRLRERVRAFDASLNRAIVECVAKMQSAAPLVVPQER
jgi:hypothetical protein